MEPSIKRQRGKSAFQPSAGQRQPLFAAGARQDIYDPFGAAGDTPPRRMGSWKPVAPDSPSQAASASALAGRKIIARPIGGTSRPTASTRKPAAPQPASTPRRIFSSSFRPGLANDNHAKFAFSPRIPQNTMKESFPAATPGRAIRASTADLNGRAMARTSTASNLFPMRIASPPPELDGDVLAKQVPNDPNKIGSVYADEFLAHLVPQELDDLQRRQFLCVLDLRRLKYAANEIFNKKDWRVNILNFAKEYEKSRSLIMLRYGLYEFKTAPTGGKVESQWKQDQGIQPENTEATVTLNVNGTKSVMGRSSTKRPAEEDLAEDNASTALSSVHKRRATDREPLAETTTPPTNTAAPSSTKTKRGAHFMDEPDENQPTKFQKSQQSSTLSIFEEVANRSPVNAAASPPKPVAKSLLGSSTPSKPAANLLAQVKPTNGQSIQGGSGLNTGSTENIFGHLASQKDVDVESEEESSGEESEVQASHSEAPSAAASGGAAIPALFGNTAPSPTKISSEAGEAFGKGASLFDRIQNGPDSQPVRATIPESEATKEQPVESHTPFDLQRTASSVKHSQPQNKTWNPDTPIKFGAGAPQSSSMFGSTTPAAPAPSFTQQPAATPSFSFGSTAIPKTTAGPASSTAVFDFAQETPKPGAPSMFGQLAKPSEQINSTFGHTFGQQNKVQEKKFSDPAPTSSTSLFGSQSKAATSETPAAQTQSKSIFAGLSTPASTAQPQSGSLFGAANGKSSAPLFGAANSDGKTTTSSFNFGGQSDSTPFGVKNTTVEKTETPASKMAPAPTAACVVFGSTSTDPAAKISFGGGPPAPATPAPNTSGAGDAASVFGATSKGGEKKFSFGGDTKAPAVAEGEKKFSFDGQTPAPTVPQGEKKISFGGSATTLAAAVAPATATTPAIGSLFGSATPQQTQPEVKSSIFAASSGPASTGFSFDSGFQNASDANPFAKATNSAQPSTLFANVAGKGGAGVSSSFTFGSDQGSFKNPFVSGADVSATPSFDFGTGGTSQGSTALFQFGGGASTPAPISAPSSFSFEAGTQPTNNTPAQPTNMFGGTSNGSIATQSANLFGGGSGNAPAQPTNMFGGNPNGGSSFTFGASQPNVPPMFGQQPPANAAQGIFASHLGPPPTGSSTGSNTPFFGGASSLATTPAAGTPEPEAKNGSEQQADEDGKPQDQISLTEGGPGEEDESVVHEVRAKALKFVPAKLDEPDAKSPWKLKGVGPLRVLKHKTTGAVRILLRADPGGHVVLNRAVLPNVEYKTANGGKYIKVMTGNDDGTGLETWMLQVKESARGEALAAALEANKGANKK